MHLTCSLVEELLTNDYGLTYKLFVNKMYLSSYLHGQVLGHLTITSTLIIKYIIDTVPCFQRFSVRGTIITTGLKDNQPLCTSNFVAIPLGMVWAKPMP